MFSCTKKTNLPKSLTSDKPDTIIKALIEDDHRIYIVTNSDEQFLLLDKKDKQQNYQLLTKTEVENISRNFPLEKNEPFKVILMCCQFSILYLTESGRIFASGTNDQNQLGLGFGSKPQIENASLVPLPIGEKVISLAGYDSSTFALCESGKLYAFGNNCEGQLLLGHQEPVYIPTLVKDISKMTPIITKEENLETTSSSYGCCCR